MAAFGANIPLTVARDTLTPVAVQEHPVAAHHLTIGKLIRKEVTDNPSAGIHPRDEGEYSLPGGTLHLSVGTDTRPVGRHTPKAGMISGIIGAYNRNADNLFFSKQYYPAQNIFFQIN